MTNRPSLRGFTLVELLVVVVVIGVLVARAVPRLTTTRDRSQDATARSNLRTARSAAAVIAAAEQSFAGAGTGALAETGLTVVGASTPSGGPDTVSVAAQASRWSAAVRSASGACFAVTVPLGGTAQEQSLAGTCSADAAQGYQVAVLDTPGLLGYWRLDDTGSQAVDASGRGNHGTYGGVVTRSVTGARPGDPSTAVTLGGSDASTYGRVDLPSFGVRSAFTINLWVRHPQPNPTPGGHDTLAAAPGIRFQIPSTSLWVQIGSGNVGGGAIPANTWAMATLTRDGTTTRLFVNGTPTATTTALEAPTLNTLRLGLDGRSGLGGIDPLHASIDEAALWDRALTDAEIARLATANG
jgi:prepilin-type N-terminal cleavage/methylation domain-containing protein